MAGNSKRKRKPSVFRPAHVPMQKSSRDRLALELHMAVEALASVPSEESANKVAKILLVMATAVNARGKGYVLDRDDADAMAIRLALEALQFVQERFERIGRYGISGDELTALRAAAGGLDRALARIPIDVFHASREAVMRMATEMEGVK